MSHYSRQQPIDKSQFLHITCYMCGAINHIPKAYQKIVACGICKRRIDN